MSNPALIEVTRGPLVECVHTGAVVLATPTGELVLALGDVARPVFPRSAIKAFQCLPFIESGAADRFGFGQPEIALACASHSGTPRQVALARSMLARAGLSEAALGCGAHDPIGETAARELQRAGVTPTAAHNNCSGKHAAMLAVAMHMGEPAAGYLEFNHPVQQRVVEVLEEFGGRGLSAEVRAVDGCSAPNWAMPLTDLARAFACFATGEGPASRHAAAVRRIASACWAEPELVAGPGRLDTIVMSRWPGGVFLKTGAEGVYCGAIVALGLGFALKIDDGGKRASEAVTRHLIARLVPDASDLAGENSVKNWCDVTVGAIRAAPALWRALDELSA